tara:strand:+ start:8963 stop:9427 length:465 start_codon:yes stop_codon:yes gene_type:complete
MDSKAEEVRKQIALTDAQRENVRKMLAKFGGQLEEENKEEEINEVSSNKAQDDLFMGVESGTTIEWHSLTPGTKKYSFVREVCCQFEGFIRSKSEVTPTQFKKACIMLGLEPNNNSNTLIACAVEQADPITMVHLQVETLANGNIIIQRLRFIT